MTEPYSRPTEYHGPAKKIAAGEFSHDLGAMLVESSPDALIALGADHAILFWSAGAEADSLQLPFKCSEIYARRGRRDVASEFGRPGLFPD